MIGTLGPMSVALLSTVAVGGIAYALLYPLISGEGRAEKRMKEIAADEITARRSRKPQDAGASRRQQIEETLKKAEERQRSRKNPPLSVRLMQAGVSWSKRQFILGSVLVGAIAAAVGRRFGMPRYVVI